MEIFVIFRIEGWSLMWMEIFVISHIEGFRFSEPLQEHGNRNPFLPKATGSLCRECTILGIVSTDYDLYLVSFLL